MLRTMHNTYSHANILKIFPNIKVRSLISWSERGLIKPLQDAAGRGSSRIYSYTNLIEIGIIAEFFRYGLGFSNVSSLMSSNMMQDILKKKSWESVVWFSYGTPANIKNTNCLISFGSAPIKEFSNRGGQLLIGSPRMSNHPEEFAASAIVVNLSAISDLVDNMITKL